jgi:hypothetical protein
MTKFASLWYTEVFRAQFGLHTDHYSEVKDRLMNFSDTAKRDFYFDTDSAKQLNALRRKYLHETSPVANSCKLFPLLSKRVPCG